MKTKLKKLKNKFNRILKIFKNILKNALKELFNHTKTKKIRRFIKEYRFYLIIAVIVLLFIAKNIYTINSYNKQLDIHNEKIVKERARNNQLKEDLQYYKSDTFIIKTATEELNLRLTEENPLYHEEIFEYIEESDESESIEENSSITNNENTNESENKNNEDDTDSKDNETNEQ